MFDKGDYRPLADGETYENKFVILDPSQFKPEYQNADEFKPIDYDDEEEEEWEE